MKSAGFSADFRPRLLNVEGHARLIAADGSPRGLREAAAQ
jgi:hypothetical protein